MDFSLSRTISILGVASAKDMFTDVVEIISSRVNKIDNTLFFRFMKKNSPFNSSCIAHIALIFNLFLSFCFSNIKKEYFCEEGYRGYPSSQF